MVGKVAATVHRVLMMPGVRDASQARRTAEKPHILTVLLKPFANEWRLFHWVRDLSGPWTTGIEDLNDLTRRQADAISARHVAPSRPSAMGETEKPNAGFRHILREATAEEHLATEVLFDPFMKAPETRMTWFLSVQRDAMGSLRAASAKRADGQGLLCREVLSDLIERLDHDLAQVDKEAALPTGSEGAMGHPELHPKAVDYVVLGSRLGSEVIRRTVLPALADGRLPLYFQAAPQADLWRYLCTSLDRLDPCSNEAQDIVKDAKTAFRLFSDAARRQEI